jgi:hypothetical protein
LENGWQEGQERQKNGANNRPVRMLRKILQISPQQKKNLTTTKHQIPSSFFFFVQPNAEDPILK